MPHPVCRIVTLALAIIALYGAGRTATSRADPIAPVAITLGSDGRLWFAETQANAVGALDPLSLAIEQYRFGPDSAPASPSGITTAPDGNTWVTLYSEDALARIGPDGRLTKVSLPHARSGPDGDVRSAPESITVGPDGGLWFTELIGKRIGRLDATGNIQEWDTLARNGAPEAIAAGPDGSVWYTDTGPSVAPSKQHPTSIGRISSTGRVTEWRIPTPYAGPNGIAPGPDGALWFTEYLRDRVGRITTDGKITEYRVPRGLESPHGIVLGPDGALWFTAYGGDAIGRLTTAGQFSSFPVPGAVPGESFQRSPRSITVGPDGALWFTETDPDRIARITTHGDISEYDIAFLSMLKLQPTLPAVLKARIPYATSGRGE